MRCQKNAFFNQSSMNPALLSQSSHTFSGRDVTHSPRGLRGGSSNKAQECSIVICLVAGTIIAFLGFVTMCVIGGITVGSAELAGELGLSFTGACALLTVGSFLTLATLFTRAKSYSKTRSFSLPAQLASTLLCCGVLHAIDRTMPESESLYEESFT